MSWHEVGRVSVDSGWGSPLVEKDLSAKTIVSNHVVECAWDKKNYFFFLLANPARLARPAPKSSMDAGSGTGLAVVPADQVNRA